MTLPSLFLSHGAPTLPLTDTPAREYLTKLGSGLARPKVGARVAKTGLFR